MQVMQAFQHVQLGVMYRLAVVKFTEKDNLILF